MRILTGGYKGKAISMPKGIRPTQGKVRKAVFDILSDINGLTFLELFAGSGAVGFEALSRGASGLVLVEPNRACQEAIGKNISALKAQNCLLIPKEAEQAIVALHKQEKKFDIIFMDPPYYQGLVKKTLQTITCYDILAPYGFLVVQHFKRDELPQKLEYLVLFKQKKYGDTILSFYKRG